MNDSIDKKKLMYVDEETHNSHLKRSILKENDILFAIAGSIGKCAIVNKGILPANTNQALAIIRLKDTVNLKYIYHILKSNAMQKYIKTSVKGSAQPNLNLQQMNTFIIPLPPLPVQEEIVRILDNFAELTAELTARKKQYEYYRGSLLTFSDEAFEWRTLGATVNLTRGVRVVRSQLNDQGNYPVYQNSMTPLGYFDESNFQAKTTFIISAGTAGSVGYSNVEFWAADDCYCLVCQKNLDSRYLYHALANQQEYIFSLVRKASVPRIGRDVVERIKIPIPYPNNIDKSLEKQQRIVDILDRFDTLCNDISSGLPAEIKAREQQYEYYRDKLLTFPKANLEV